MGFQAAFADELLKLAEKPRTLGQAAEYGRRAAQQQARYQELSDKRQRIRASVREPWGKHLKGYEHLPYSEARLLARRDHMVQERQRIRERARGTLTMPPDVVTYEGRRVPTVAMGQALGRSLPKPAQAPTPPKPAVATVPVQRGQRPGP